MAINSNTITSLMLATGHSMESGQGFNLNETLNEQVLVYTDAHVVQSSEVSAYLQGNLVTDGINAYDYYVDSAMAANASTGVLETVFLPVRNLLGTLEDVVPGGWGINGEVYNGSLSGYGGMVAERTSPGYKPAFYYELETTGSFKGSLGFGNLVLKENTPTYRGRYQTYYSDMTQVTLGASTIPAITQVVPSSVTGIPGSLKYWLDQAINRPLGTNIGTDLNRFLLTFTQAYGYISNANRYLSAVRTTETRSLSDYGARTYQDLITQGWLKYQSGQALRQAFINIGTMTDSIYTGNFGTAGATAFVLLGRGLGKIGGLNDVLTEQKINVSDIMNPMYDAQVTRVLSNITDPADLETIQETIESTIPNMKSALDYTSIGACAGMVNDSEFETFAEVGVDLFNKGQYMSIERGTNVVDIIDKILAPFSEQVEAVAGRNTLLTSSITNDLRNKLPVSQDDTAITLFDVIGTPAGYFASNIQAVNEGLRELDGTDYGPQIRSALQQIVMATNELDDFGNPLGIPTTVAIQNYESLLAQIVSDTGSVKHIVDKINSNYLYISQRVALETENWNRAKFVVTSTVDGQDKISWATGLHSYAKDFQGVKTYEYLMGLVDATQTGDLIVSTMAEGKNYGVLTDYNINPNSYVG